jgi:acyl-CoA synthetase (AMP-forming)/AMP-acid ligase II
MLPVDCLYRGLSIAPDGIAVEDETRRLTYRELVAKVEALAGAYQAMLPGSQNVIATGGKNNIEHLIAILAIYVSGNIWTALNPRGGPVDNDALIATVEPTLIVADEDMLDRFTPTAAPLVIADPAGGKAPKESVAALVERYAERRAARPVLEPTDLQSIKFTGGSTGRPKAVMLPYRTQNAVIANMLAHFPFTADEVHLCVAPITHAVGTYILPVFAKGGRHVMMRKPVPALVLEALERRGVTLLFLAPTMIYTLLAEPGVAERRYPALRHMIYGAASMPAEKVRAARAVFGPVIETSYGQTEAPQVISAVTAAEYDDERNLASVGRPCIFNRVEIMGPDRAILPPGETGEIVVRGDLVMKGYYRNPEATAAAIIDGWLHTGDVGYRDERGYLFIKDRLKDVVITGGFNVYPADVEGVLVRHPAVYESVVFGVADDKWGERVEAAVQLRPGATAEPAELAAFVKERLGSVKAPKIVHLVEDLPRNHLGKVLRREVRARFDRPERRQAV